MITRSATLVLALVTLIPAVAAGQEQAIPEVARTQQANWAFEFKGGPFHPDIDNWGDFYGDDKMGQFALALGYKIANWFEVGLEGAYMQDEGRGFAPLHGTTTGKVSYELAPLHVFLLLRGSFTDRQWLVPYVGGGWTRMHYRIGVTGQDEITGSGDGTHVRGGLQLLLDEIDRPAAYSLRQRYGVLHTYLFLEVQQSDVEVAGQQIGGTSYLGGFRMEF